MVSENLKHLRMEKKLTQKKLAEETGISYSAICKYEAENNEPSPKTRKILAEYFDVSEMAFINMENEMDLQILRKAKDITQRQLANEIGVSQQALSNWESGKRPLPNEAREKIALVFNVRADEIETPIKPVKIIRHPYFDSLFSIKSELNYLFGYFGEYEPTSDHVVKNIDRIMDKLDEADRIIGELYGCFNSFMRTEGSVDL
jgi:transcriptional regulator with XRE-family HTH domain